MAARKNGLPLFVQARGLFLADLLFLFGGHFLAFAMRFGYPLQDPNIQDFQNTFLALIPLRFFLYALLGLYRTDLDETLLDLLYRVFWVCLIISGLEWLILLGIRNYYLPDMGISRQLVIPLWMTWFGAALLTRGISGWYGRKYRVQRSRILFVGSGKIEPILYQEIQDIVEMGYSVVGFLGNQVEVPDGHLPLLGKLDELPLALDAHDVRQVVVWDDRLARERLSWLLGHCEPRSVSVRILPSLYEVMIGQIRITRAAGIPLVEVGAESFSVVTRFLKRALDISVALLAFMAVFWIWLMICLLLKLDRGGPVLERIPCLGWKGKPFHLLRFRTVVEEQSEPVESQKLNLSPVGYLVRRLDLDRIPQLLNVLSGDLSLVGPRPMTPDFFDRIIEEEPLYRYCLTLKPGVTGLAQIHGQSHHLSSKLRYDLSYIKNCSLLLDLKILFQSISVMITGRKIKA